MSTSSVMRRSAVLILVAILLGCDAKTNPAPPPIIDDATRGPGYGPWQFGMSPYDVEGATAYGPYAPVASTGGLKTANGSFDGHRAAISFVFGDQHLRKIQISAYEGNDVEAALDAWWQVRQYLERVYGALVIPWLSDAVALGSDRQSFLIATREVTADQPNSQIKLQMIPAAMPPAVTVFSSFIHVPGWGYYVFVSYQAP